MPLRAAKSFRQAGFQFGIGLVFSNADTLKHVHTATVGPFDHIETGVKTRQRVSRDSLVRLFQTMKGKEMLYKALRDTKVFWDTVSVNWEILEDLSAEDVRVVAITFIQGRKAFNDDRRLCLSSRNQKTPLTEAVDVWMAIHDEVSALEPPKSFELTLRHPPLDTTIHQAKVWPPQYLNAQECAWISDDHIENQLQARQGSFPFTPKSGKDIPRIPHNVAFPQDIKLFLCWAVLARYAPSVSKFSLFMAPIAFRDEDDRKDWYLATGSLPKRHATIGEFFDYAMNMLEEEGRELVVGMMTYWIPDAREYVNNYEDDKEPGQTRAEY
ncbi:hypothetical protein JX265_009904 [Neoarthrinium moseri]|uniref:Uncharacterized protein n=1 Tax=Neoarthrinium moseri TaxID=1658444 RepID=A0A9Q0AIW8_9PEZI|nr:hypothetical protein JX265_009904 [Neoarthrinium moseri]